MFEPIDPKVLVKSASGAGQPGRAGVVYQVSDAAGTLARWDGRRHISLDAGAAPALYLWAASKVSGLSVIAKAMLELEAVSLLPAPAKIMPAKATGNTRYCNPTWGGPFNGTFAQPYNSPSQATLAAGDQLLFPVGADFTVSSHIFPAVTGTQANRIIYGVYDPTTGERVIGVVGAATIRTTDALGAVFIVGNTKDWVCIDGLRLVGGPVNTFGVIDTNGALNCHITNCEILSGGFAGIRVYGNGHVIQGCTIRNNGGDGVYVYQVGNIPSNAVVQYNSIHSNVGSGFYAWDSGGAAAYTGTVACNTFRANGGSTVGRGGVSILNGGGAAKIYRNRISRSPRGVGMDGVGAASVDFTGAVIENNDIADTGEFGIHISAARGAWLVQSNRILRSGSFDAGVTQGSVTGYGRAIELYGAAAATATQDGVVRHNFISGAYSWLSDGSEGVGIGLDDQTRNVDVHSNFVELCEGNGIQVNRGFGNRVFGNVLVDNLIAPPARNLIFSGAFAGQIFFIGTPHLRVFNNTCIFSGRVTSPNQRYGIAENDFVLSRGAQVFNNLIVGALYAGITKTQNANGTVETTNRVIDAPRLVVDCTTLANIAPGAATSFASADQIDPGSPIPCAKTASALDNTGVSAPAGCPSFAGLDLAMFTPIGALHAITDAPA